MSVLELLSVRVLMAALACLVLLGLGSQTLAGEYKIVLREYLGQNWPPQLLTYPFSAPQGACRAESLSLEGPDGPQAVQLFDVEFWPGTPFVKSATLALITDLPPRATKEFTVRYDDRSRAPVPRTDLRITEGEGKVEIATGALGAVLLLGEKTYPQPVAASEVPGPLVSLRLPDGTAYGGSRMFGPTPVKSYAARLLDRGPVFARVEYIYTYADGNTLRLLAQVNAGDLALLWDSEVKEDRPDDGVDFLLSPGLPTLVFPVNMEFFTKRPVFLERKAAVGDLAELSLDTYGERLVTKLTPWNDWWDDYTQIAIPLRITGKDTTLRLSSRDPGAWVEPAAPGTMRDWGAWQHKLIPLERADDGLIYLRVNNAQGIRRWTHAHLPAQTGQTPFQWWAREVGQPPLDVVKDYVLDWPEQPGSHPRLFFSKQRLEEYFRTAPHDQKQIDWILGTKPEIRSEPSYKDAWALEAWLRSGGKREIAEQVQLAQRLRQHLNLLGKFDTMRSTGIVAVLYDALIDTDLIPPEDRDLYRAQIAYLAYKINDPSTWSIERGYRSYNENMSVSHMLARGILAALLADHPMARTWAEPAVARMKQWMTAVGPEGEWFEGGHYDQVTYSTMIWFAIAAQRAGFYDFARDPAFKKFGMYIAKQQTPPDPQRGNRRVPPPLGRAQAGVPWAHLGLLAPLTRESDPEYSAIMQWCWAQTGYDMKVMDSRLAGMEVVYLDPNLPQQRPNWGSDWFPLVGAILRNGVGTEEENYVNLLTNSKIEFARVSEPGCVLKWFAKGRPIAGLFCPGYSERQELLTTRVLRARTWQPGDNWFLPFGNATNTAQNEHAFLPRADYVNTLYNLGGAYDAGWWTTAVPKDLPPWPPVAAEGKVPFTWRRQVLYLKDDLPGGPNYLILRDTVTGNQPTMWQFWTLSEKIGTPEEAANLEAFLADKPGLKAVPPRPLTGDRFTAIGQLDVDLEYFIASPAGTPRWTLRWGTHYQDYGVVGDEYQDLLQIQMPGDGAYYVALFPRYRTEAVPAFTALAEGKIIKVSGDFGTDYGFLAAEETEAVAEGVRFRGTTGSVQDRGQGDLVLALSAPGEVAYRQYGLAANQPASLRAGADTVAVHLPAKHPEGEVTLSLPGAWKPAKEVAGVRLARRGDAYVLTVPADLPEVQLVRE